MSKRNFVIYDTEEWYGKKLNEFIHAKCREDYEFFLFTKKEPLYEFLATNPAEILLAADLSEREADPGRVKHFITLAGAPVADADNSAVYKYGSAQDLLRKVMRISAADEAADTKGTKKAGVTGFYSPVKRSGQTTLALTLGQMKAKKKKTLYIGFESYSALCTSEEEKGDLMDLLYFSECSSGNFALRVSSLAGRIGELDYIPPVRSRSKYKEIGKEQWLSLIRRISTETDYEYVILDLSEEVEGLHDVLACCDRIYVSVETDKNARKKLEVFEKALLEEGREDLSERMIRLNLPRFEMLPEEPELLPYGELADHVKRIIDKEDNN